MSGAAELFVQPSSLTLLGQLPGVWARGIPVPGVPLVTPVPAVQGVASCRDLLFNSPPTLLEEYEIYSYAIGWGAYLTNSVVGAAVPNVIFELALLVNDRVRDVQVSEQAATAVATTGGAPQNSAANGVWMADLVNPLSLRARDRLSLRIGLVADQQLSSSFSVIGCQLVPGAAADQVTAAPYESTVSYRVLDLPAHRSL